MTTHYIFEQRIDPTTHNKQYRITVVQGEKAEVMNTMLNHDSTFTVIEIYDDIEAIMIAVERYMNMEAT
jgi:hypothetical protein